MNDVEIDIDKIANIARIWLTEDDKLSLKSSLGAVLGHINKLSEVNVDGVEPATTGHNVLREDDVSDSFTEDVALRNAPKKRNGLLIVPKVVE